MSWPGWVSQSVYMEKTEFNSLGGGGGGGGTQHPKTGNPARRGTLLAEPTFCF